MIGSAEDLGSVMEVRELPVPPVRRGGAAPFHFDEGRRGWVAALPEGNLLLTPAYADGTILVGGGFSSSSVYALDAVSGAFRWQAAASDGGPSAAIVDDGRAFYNTESCTIFAVDADTGRPLWSRYLGDPMMAQPAAADGRVFTSHKNQEGPGHMMTALQAATGRVLWQVPLGADVITAPTLSRGRLVYATMNGFVERRDPRTGRRLWRRATRAVSAPWVSGDRVFLSRRVAAPGGARGPYEQQVVLGIDDGRVLVEGQVVAAPHLTGAGRGRRLLQGQNGAWQSDATTPAARHLGIRSVADGWAYQGARPTVIDGRSYAAVGDAIECRELETGRLVWRRRYAEDRGAQAMSPPAVVGAQMIVATIDGHVHAIDIDSGAPLWAWDVGEPIAYQPAVAKGWVYVGTATGKVIAFEVADESLDGWHMWGGNATHDGLVDDSAPARTVADDRPGEGVLRVVPPGRDEPVGLPLAHTGVQVAVAGFVGSVSVAQTFENPYEQPLEAVYHFPLPTNAAVDAMIVRVAERTILGRIERRERARVLYRAARDAGAVAALLEEQRPDLFTQRVANVPPGGRVTVELHYVQLLPYDEGAYELRFPMVTERRAAASAGADEEIAGLEGAGFRRARSVDIVVDLDAGVPVEGIESPTHAVAIESRDERRARVALDDTGPIAARDFLLRWQVAGETPRAAVLSHADERGGFFTLMLQPARDDAPVLPTRRRVTIAVDTSSSMHGRPMEHARTIAATVLESLQDADSFQVVSFSDLVRRFPESPSAATDAAIVSAEGHLEGLRALGTTSLRAALEAMLGAPAAPDDVLEQVVLVTDGYVADDREILREVQARLGRRRLVVLGVGTSVNRFLLERLAEVGRGTLKVIGPGEDPEVVAQSVVERLDRPQLTDLTIDWGDLAVHSVYPRRLPDLVAGQPVLVTGRFDAPGEAVVRIAGRMGGRSWTDEEVVVLDSFTAGNEAMAPVWARARATDLMNALWLEDDPDAEEQVTELGLEFGLVTRFTSFVAVDDAFLRRASAAGVPSGDSPAMPTEPRRDDLVGEMNGVAGLGLRGFGGGGGGIAQGTIGLGSTSGMGRAGPMALAEPAAPMAQGYGSGAGSFPSRSVSAPTIRAAQAQITGALSSDAIRRHVQTVGGRVRACYETGLRANPRLSGRVSIRFAIGPDGRVTSALTDESTLGHVAVEQCIATAVRTLVFPAVPGGAPMVVTYPFVLQPTEPPRPPPRASLPPMRPGDDVIDALAGGG